MNITLMAHQKLALQRISEHPFVALFYETGTGKTPIGLEAAEFWYRQGLRRFVCVVPNSLTGNWVEEAARFEFALRTLRVEGSREARINTIEESDWDFLVINYESVRSLWPSIVAMRPQGLIMDELQRVKDRKSQQSKGCRQIAVAVKRNGGCVLGLTGTPVVNKPFDLWSEFDILWPGGKPQEHVLGYGNYWNFESSICTKIPHPVLGKRAPIFKFSPANLQILKQRVAQFALEASKDDCLDLPPRTFQVLRVEMTPIQKRLYKQLRDDMVAYLETNTKPTEETQKILGSDLFDRSDIFLDSEQTGESRRVSVSFATTLLIRLHQIASGFVKRDDGEIIDLDSAKLALLRDYIQDWTDPGWGNKLLIFHRYTYDRKMISELLDSLRIKYVSLSGLNSSEAAEVVKQFQTDPETRVFIGNVQVASVGITLTAANYVCFWNNSFQMEHRMQAMDRAYRIGQTRKVSYYDLVARGTVDEHVLKNLNEKQTLAIATVKDLVNAFL